MKKNDMKIGIFFSLIFSFCLSVASGAGLSETPCRESLGLGSNDEVGFKSVTLTEKVKAAWAEILGDTEIGGRLDVTGAASFTSDVEIGGDVSAANLGTMAGETATDYLKNDGGNAAATVAFNTVSFATGTAAAPGLYPAGDPDTGFYSDAVNTLSLSVGGYQTEKQKRGYRYQLPDSDDITRHVSYDIANAVYRLNYSAYRGTLRIGGGASEFAPARTIEFYSSATDSAGIGTLTMSITDSVQKNHAPSDTARGIQVKIQRIAALADSGAKAITSGIAIGFLWIHNTTNGTCAQFLVNTNKAETVLIAQDTIADFSASKDNAATTNVYVDSGVVYVQNKMGSARNYTLKLETFFPSI